MRGFLFGLFASLCSLKGVACLSWTVTVKRQVNGSLGQNVILPCVFTHPKQYTYTSSITVKWLQHHFTNHPVFHCSLRNQTSGPDQSCSDPRSPKRFWLHGNPRKGDISLGINDAQFTDIKHYVCRVELDYNSYQSTSTLLNITAPAQILNLTLDSETTAQGERLKCIARGNPVPTVKWTFSNGSLGSVLASKINHSNYTVISWTTFSGQGVYTCRAENSLGQTERTFPTNHHNDPGVLDVWTLWISVVGCLLFLGLLGLVVGGVVIRRRSSVQTAMLRNVNLQNKIYFDQDNDAPIYTNVSCNRMGGGTRRLVPEIPVRGLDEPVYVDSNESTNPTRCH